MRDNYWKIMQFGKIPKLNNPVFIEGLPGIGNVGKVAVDFVIDETIKQRIKPSQVEIIGKLKITTYAPNGVDIIKESLKKAEDAAKGKVNINYLGSGLYRFMVTAPDYKEAEKLMKNATESAIGNVTKNFGIAEFNRESS